MQVQIQKKHARPYLLDVFLIPLSFLVNPLASSSLSRKQPPFAIEEKQGLPSSSLSEKMKQLSLQKPLA